MKRRKFIASTTSATTALLLSSMDIFAKPQTVKNMNNNFQLKIYNQLGFPVQPIRVAPKVKQEGYDGIEIWWPT